jgi:hypothetical protein
LLLLLPPPPPPPLLVFLLLLFLLLLGLSLPLTLRSQVSWTLRWYPHAERFGPAPGADEATVK